MRQEGGVYGVPNDEVKSKTDGPFSDIDISEVEFSVDINSNPIEDYFNLDVKTTVEFFLAFFCTVKQTGAATYRKYDTRKGCYSANID